MSKLPIFDPKQVPVFQVDTHLEAVPAHHLTPQALQARFANPPVWQPELVRERKFMDRDPAQAAVLLGIVMRDEPAVLLTQRPAHMSTHAGQIAFAGGKCDEGDADVAATALREAHEEVGLDARHVQVGGLKIDAHEPTQASTAVAWQIVHATPSHSKRLEAPPPNAGRPAHPVLAWGQKWEV